MPFKCVCLFVFILPLLDPSLCPVSSLSLSLCLSLRLSPTLFFFLSSPLSFSSLNPAPKTQLSRFQSEDYFCFFNLYLQPPFSSLLFCLYFTCSSCAVDPFSHSFFLPPSLSLSLSLSLSYTPPFMPLLSSLISATFCGIASDELPIKCY